MSNATTPRKMREVSVKQIKRVLKNASVAVEGAIACIDTTDGALVPAATATTLIPIGYFIDLGTETSVTGDGTKQVKVRLFKEVIAFWYVNDTGTPVTDAKMAQIVYLLDNQTLSGNATGKSIAGRCWGVDTVKGVLCEPQISASL
jgi:hypothetical protein